MKFNKEGEKAQHDTARIEKHKIYSLNSPVRILPPKRVVLFLLNGEIGTPLSVRASQNQCER